MSFTFVRIPVSIDENVVEIVKSLSGGLENDELQRFVKEYLHVEIVNITTLGLPTLATNYVGISMYSNGDGQELGLSENYRATNIAKACGHSVTIFGDAFLSRYYDNDAEEWQRVDFFATETDINSEWVEIVGKANKGKNLSSYTTGGSLQQLLTRQPAAINPFPQEPSPKSLWSQTSEDIEVSDFSFCFWPYLNRKIGVFRSKSLSSPLSEPRISLSSSLPHLSPSLCHKGQYH